MADVPRPPRTLRIGIVEDDRRTREGLAALIGGAPGFAVVGTFHSMERALAAFADGAPDIVLAGIGLPGMSGTDGVRALRARVPEQQVLMLTVHGDTAHVFDAICAGACGYLLKDTPPDKLLAALRELDAGGAPMSPEVARKVVRNGSGPRTASQPPGSA
jgi:DNA-binding NarL/FixJ family response regulator